MSKESKVGVPAFFTAPITVTRDNVTIKLPKETKTQIDLRRTSVFCTFIDGVLQISGFQPNVAIPVKAFDKDAFVPQS